MSTSFFLRLKKEKMQKYLSCFSALAGLALLSGFPTDVHAGGWTVCNKTANLLQVAIGYAAHGGITTEGYWTLGPCTGCKHVLNPGETDDRNTAYLHAHIKGGGGIVEGSERFCIGGSPFTINNAQRGNCNERRSFQPQNVNLNKNWTTNITGSPRCNID